MRVLTFALTRPAPAADDGRVVSRFVPLVLVLGLACSGDDRPGPRPAPEEQDTDTCETNPDMCAVALCDPLFQDCEEGMGCYPTGSGFDCYPPTGDQILGEPCGFVAECVPGLFCAAGISVPDCPHQGCCTEFCDLSDPTSSCSLASKGAECLSLFSSGARPPGLESLGACLLPN